MVLPRINVCEIHNRDPSLLSFIGISYNKPNWSGGARKRSISQEEMKWIYGLGPMTPIGLNIDLEWTSFRKTICIFRNIIPFCILPFFNIFIVICCIYYMGQIYQGSK
ncbi:hypothetical protein XELAEV_18032729mg [Xenopus laevis]|uniref:Uncharacterized protein n=1 Tax=Xenopus laevis TaxID=8355 RepID=A0A974CI27_XENLA|nr:hypothetical protein XELAEV_18032729mg [Xenopus laevis]